jgi:peptidoglycan/LPS O-acetylase OafA/YrhL
MACWTLLISYIAAFLSFQFWEKPFQALRHRSPSEQAPSSRISDPSTSSRISNIQNHHPVDSSPEKMARNR